MMDITYTSHAVDRMIQRKISTDEVELLLSKPDGIIKQSMDKFIYYKNIDSRNDNNLAAVIVDRKNAGCEVITVMVNFEVKNESSS